MKIAKKVLALVMAVAMVACFAAVSFAADAKIALKVGDVVDGKVKVQAIATDAAALKSADWVLVYDEALTLTTPANAAVTNPANGTGDLAQIGTDTVALAAMGGNLMTAYNAEVAGEVQIGFAFKEALGTDAETILFTAEFAVAEGAENVEIKLTNKDGSAVDSVVLFEKEEEAPSTEAPSTEAPSTEAPTTAPDKNDGNNPMGDTGVLAIAAGVVALAGAAFVVSKKRK